MYERIIRQIEEDIVFGVYPPGTKLVGDRLSERFDLSRHNLRQMLAELQETGLVRKIPNRGVRVVEPTPDEIDELYEIRTVLESHAATRTRLPVSPSILDELELKFEAHRNATEQGDLRAVFQRNLAFHSIQFSACPNEKLRDAIEHFARKVHIVRAVKYLDSDHLEEVVIQHRAILTALRGSDVGRYERAVREHLPASSRAYRIAYDMKHDIR